MKCFPLLYIYYLFIASTVVQAGNPNIINYSRDQYHATNKNWTISEDSLGILYFGNNSGLIEFDGSQWTINTLFNNTIVRAVYASDSVIYSGGFEEFGYWIREQSGQLKYHSLSDSLPKEELHNADVWRIFKHQDNIYFQGFNCIFSLHNHTLKKIAFNREFVLLMSVNNGTKELWIQKTNNALYSIDGDQLLKIPGSEMFKNTTIRVVLPFQQTKYLIATSTQGFFIYDGNSFTPFPIQEESRTGGNGLDMNHSEINCGIQASDGKYYIGTILNGIYVLDAEGKFLNHFNSSTSLQNNTVLYLHEDHSKNIWAALDKGISCIQYLKNMSCFTDPSGKTGSVFSVATFANKFFVGTNQGLFYTQKVDLNNASFLSHLTLIPGTQGQVWTLKVVNNTLYCGHNKNLLAIDSNLVVSTPYAVNSGVYTIVPFEHYLFLATYNSFVTINLATHTLNNIHKINEPIIDITLDHLGNVWLEHTDHGVYCCRMNKDYSQIESFQYLGSPEDHQLPTKLHLFKIGGRVVFLGNDHFFTYDDITNKMVSDLKLDACFKDIKNLRKVDIIDQNHFWVFGNNIIYKLYYDGITAKVQEKYDIGYNNMSLVDGNENIIQLGDSLSYICLDNGFLLYKSEASPFENGPLKQPYLKSVASKNNYNQINYLNTDEAHTVPFSYNTLTFNYTSQDLFSHNIYFQYKLEPLTDWSELTLQNQVIYERLPKGEYIFKLRTSDQLGNVSKEISYPFEILPPWNETLLFRLAAILLGFLIIIGIWLITLRWFRNVHLKKVRLREEARLRRRNSELQHQVEDKDAELLSQTSFIVQKNELIFKIKHEIDHFYNHQHNKALTPLYQKINALLSLNLDSDTDWKMFLIKFEQKHTEFFKVLKELYPQLTSNDLKFCACLKINLDSKEIASLMNISVRAVENGRYRIRKKLEIPTRQNLNDFFMNI